MKENNTTCKDVMHHICDNLGDDLDSNRCKGIKEHLENCENCKKYFKSMNTTIQFYKKYNVNLSRDTQKRLLDFLGLNE